MTEDDFEALPPRPRRRLLGAGGNPTPLALLGVLLIACGFIAGVLVEKSQTASGASGSSGGAAGLAARFAALRSGSGAGSGTSAGGGGPTSGFAASGSGASGRATIGQVAYINGSTLYVTNAEGNTIKVKTSPSSTITKTVKADVKGIRPGETVLITGATSAKGEVSAESIRVGGAGSGGLGALFDGSAKGAGGGGRGGGGSSGSGEPALFGKGG